MTPREREALGYSAPLKPDDRSGRALRRALLAVDTIVGAARQLDPADQAVLAGRLDRWRRWLPDADQVAS